MSINKEERKIIVGLEVEKAQRTFAEIEVLRQAGLWDNIANRLYYAAFHAVSAIAFAITQNSAVQHEPHQ